VLLEFIVTAAPAALMLTPPIAVIEMLPGLLLLALEVLTGAVRMLLMLRSSAKAGLAIPASKKHVSERRFARTLTGI
jgi:hypothetical protein